MMLSRSRFLAHAVLLLLLVGMQQAGWCDEVSGPLFSEERFDAQCCSIGGNTRLIYAIHEVECCDFNEQEDIDFLPLYLVLWVPKQKAGGEAVPALLPGFVIVHGGAFMVNEADEDEMKAYGEALARRGYVCASIQYRLMNTKPPRPGPRVLDREPNGRHPAFEARAAEEFQLAIIAMEEDDVDFDFYCDVYSTLMRWGPVHDPTDEYDIAARDENGDRLGCFSEEAKMAWVDTVEAAVIDTITAVEWMHGTTESGEGIVSLQAVLDNEFGAGVVSVDPDRIALGGISAGSAAAQFAAYNSFNRAPARALWADDGGIDSYLITLGDPAPMIAFDGDADPASIMKLVEFGTETLESQDVINRLIVCPDEGHGFGPNTSTLATSSLGFRSGSPPVGEALSDFMYVHLDLPGLAAENGEAQLYAFRDSEGDPLASFDSEGNLTVIGGLTEEAGALLTPTAEKEVIIRDSDEQVLVRLDAEGNLYIKGHIYENAPPVYGSEGEGEGEGECSVCDIDDVPEGVRSFKIRNSSQVAALINAESFTLGEGASQCSVPAGSIILRGRAFIGDEPDYETASWLTEVADVVQLSFAIDEGAETASGLEVTLNNACTECLLEEGGEQVWARPQYYMASEDDGFAGCSWLDYSEAPAFTLSENTATVRTVYFKVKYAADGFSVEEVSPAVSDTIGSPE